MYCPAPTLLQHGIGRKDRRAVLLANIGPGDFSSVGSWATAKNTFSKSP